MRILGRKIKAPNPERDLEPWCERWDSNPHGITTRTSNVLVYHSNTLANIPRYYNREYVFCQ